MESNVVSLPVTNPEQVPSTIGDLIAVVGELQKEITASKTATLRALEEVRLSHEMMTKEFQMLSRRVRQLNRSVRKMFRRTFEVHQEHAACPVRKAFEANKS